MLKYLNKGISTPIAITIILVCAVLVGGYTYWQYLEIEREKVEIPEVRVPEREVFTIYRPFHDGPQKVAVPNVSIPLDESEAVKIFKKVIGENPSCYENGEKKECPVTKTDEGWQIVSRPLHVSTIYFKINEGDRFVSVKGGN